MYNVFVGRNTEQKYYGGKNMNTDEIIMKIYEELQEVKAEVKEIRLTLENETNKKIDIIADGHLDLSRNLHDALRVNTEKEMLSLRVTSLENEVRRLKERMKTA